MGGRRFSDPTVDAAHRLFSLPSARETGSGAPIDAAARFWYTLPALLTVRYLGLRPFGRLAPEPFSDIDMKE